MNFEIQATDNHARACTLTLPHGKVHTPIFMPVGTVGSVKTMVPEDLNGIGAEIILGNTYHLFLRPGEEIIKSFGGLHDFVKWSKPILTDSGGFQVFSLSKLNKIKEEGVTFQSHIDGKTIFLSPEEVVRIQDVINSDIQMVLDECTAHPATYDVAKASMERSMRWAARARKARTKLVNAQFGIVQGSMYEDLRRQSCRALIDIGFEGYAIGGLSVGEGKMDMRNVLDIVNEELPKDRPRYLMGVGTPLDIVEAVSRGVDMFDCVMPTRNGRNGTLFTSTGRVNIRNEIYKFDKEPLDKECSCYTCRTFSRSYLRHLHIAQEFTALRLLSLHNLTYYLKLSRDIRSSILAGSFQELYKHHRDIWAAREEISEEDGTG